MSVKQLVRFQRKHCKDVGREYETLRNVWDTPNDKVQTGLLHLILDKLEDIETQSERHKEPLDVHREFLRVWHKRLVRDLKIHRKQIERVSKFCDVQLLRDECIVSCDINRFAYWYRENQRPFLSRVAELTEKIERLKRVKSLADLENLRGIGSKTAESIRAKMKAAC